MDSVWNKIIEFYSNLGYKGVIETHHTNIVCLFDSPLKIEEIIPLYPEIYCDFVEYYFSKKGKQKMYKKYFNLFLFFQLNQF